METKEIDLEKYVRRSSGWLRARREERGLNVTDFANLIGYNPTTIGCYLNGTRVIGKTPWIYIIQGLGQEPPQDLLDAAPKGKGKRPGVMVKAEKEAKLKEARAKLQALLAKTEPIPDTPEIIVEAPAPVESSPIDAKYKAMEIIFDQLQLLVGENEKAPDFDTVFDLVVKLRDGFTPDQKMKLIQAVF